jgi:hypothetical protein
LNAEKGRTRAPPLIIGAQFCYLLAVKVPHLYFQRFRPQASGSLLVLPIVKSAAAGMVSPAFKPMSPSCSCPRRGIGLLAVLVYVSGLYAALLVSYDSSVSTQLSASGPSNASKSSGNNILVVQFPVANATSSVAAQSGNEEVPAKFVISTSPIVLKQDNGEKFIRAIDNTNRTIRIFERQFPPIPPSTYEKQNPGHGLAQWAKKPFYTRTEIPDNKRVCFVHVGKTAGSSMGCLLGFTLYCDGRGNITTVSGLLPRYTTNLNHDSFNDCPDDTAYYLFAVRHPLERIQSWFVYDRKNMVHLKNNHNQAKLFVDCPFRTLNDLAELGLADGGNTTETCRRRAKKGIQGLERFGFHAYFNYAHYYRSVPRGAKILATRTKHLVEDWNTAEVLLGGQPNSLENMHHQNAGDKRAPDHYLSDKARSLLCRALCHEILIYKVLLVKALNLNRSQVETSLAELKSSCPLEAEAMSCKKKSHPLY